jgi:hypothetical protein
MHGNDACCNCLPTSGLPLHRPYRTAVQHVLESHHVDEDCIRGLELLDRVNPGMPLFLPRTLAVVATALFILDDQLRKLSYRQSPEMTSTSSAIPTMWLAMRVVGCVAMHGRDDAAGVCV